MTKPENPQPIVSLIVAKDRNNGIGRDNELPWRLKSDLQRFKAVTLGKPIIMGRKTWLSLGRPLPGRLNIVLSRQADFVTPEGCIAAGNLQSGIRLAVDAQPDVSEVMVIGGAELYREALEIADRLYLSEVDAEVDADAWFPDIDESEWQEQELQRVEIPADKDNEFAHTFRQLEKIAAQ